ncbi:hypothetical protein ACFVX9_04225 [Kitasatospora sp. NPDC058243]|uniref:hypothetical protein n=1 Tax=Kitasatospora sp. NPDC058243 TaxID=3346397 RepID=UPI0036DB3E92
MSANALTPARPGSASPLWTVRGVLALDALVTGGNGLVYLAFAGPVGELLGSAAASCSPSGSSSPATPSGSVPWPPAGGRRGSRCRR